MRSWTFIFFIDISCINFFIGRRDWNRTSDFVFWRHAFYQLNYPPMLINKKPSVQNPSIIRILQGRSLIRCTTLLALRSFTRRRASPSIKNPSHYARDMKESLLTCSAETRHMVLRFLQVSFWRGHPRLFGG